MRRLWDIRNQVHDFFVLRRMPQSKAGGSCAYLGDGGSRCGVGCLLPEVLSAEQFEAVKRCENRGIGSLRNTALDGFIPSPEVKQAALTFFDLIRVDPEDADAVRYCRAIQQLHDNWQASNGCFAQWMRSGLRAVSIAAGLED
jgi:hypothetical protein